MSTRGDKVVFVPSLHSGTRRETAILLVGTAAEHGLGDDAVHMDTTGFFISDDLADILYAEDVLDEDDEAPPETSGNRAAKK